MLHAHVKVAGVNSLDLDFGDNRYPVTEMLPAVESSLRIAHGQLAAIFGRNRVGLSSQELWGRMGSTVQIGQNAVNKEAFGIYDAEQFVAFAKDVGLGRVSMWSLNRDSQCGTDFPVLGELSNTCSGVAQGNLQFSSIFASLHGHTPALSVPTSAAPTASPNNYPFPLWQADEAYNGGYLVVWQGDVYVAKYFTQGVAPDTPTSYTYQDPWELLGPVLTSDSAPTTTTLPAGTYPKWTATASYPQGARVLYEGLPFVAKYYTVGSSPGAVDVDPQYSPWQPLYTVPNEP
jgi:chitinase